MHKYSNYPPTVITQITDSISEDIFYPSSVKDIFNNSSLYNNQLLRSHLSVKIE